MINSVQDIANGSTIENTRLDSLVQRVQALEISQSLWRWFKVKTFKSRPSSDQGDKESSVVEPGTSEDLAAVLDAAVDTPILNKRNSAPGKTRRDSFYIRQPDSDENEVTIKYHTKAPDKPESLKKISRHC